MKIRTVEELADYIDEELSWRKKELIYLNSLIKVGSTNITDQVIVRAAITTLYAHWEGFIKNTGMAYVTFVAQRRLRYEQLSSNFIALALRKKLEEITKTTKASFNKELVQFFTTGLTASCNVFPEDSVKTNSNLNSEVLKEIICYLGFDYSFYESKEKLLDERLLGSRNKIAHGRYLIIDADSYLELHDEVLSLMNIFKNQIINAAVNHEYQKLA